VFEFIHPEARIITNYGDREDLVLLAVFDHQGFRYLPYGELAALGEAYGLTTVDALSPRGETLAQQIDDLLAALAGTDQEGSVLNCEQGGEVIYRVKVKSPAYLSLVRHLAECTYERTVEVLDAHPHLGCWAEVQEHLKRQGREAVPEEVLVYYREYYERFLAYRADCERLIAWAGDVHRRLADALRADAGLDPREYRKAFAALATRFPFSSLVFAALDGRLDLAKVRKHVRSPEEAREAVRAVQGVRSEATDETRMKHG
jgi:hypothetical protein